MIVFSLVWRFNSIHLLFLWECGIVIYVWLIHDVSVTNSCFGLCIWKVINSTVPSLIYQITFKKLYHIIPSLVYQTISKKIKNQEVNRLSCPLRSSVRKAVLGKFGLSCNQLKHTELDSTLIGESSAQTQPC